MQFGQMIVTKPSSDRTCDNCAGKAMLLIDGQLQCLTCAGERFRSEADALGALALAVLTMSEHVEISA